MPVLEDEKVKNETAYPILKWAGGKRQLITDLKKHMPESYNHYFEPFIGGAALFLNLDTRSKESFISDINHELINVYEVIKNDVEELILELQKHKKNDNEEYFYKIRAVDRKLSYKNWSNIKKAGRFVYLNRTCFNGLYRVNSKGQFNVPYAYYNNPRIVDEDNLRKCSNVFKTAKISCASFESILNLVKENDFVYLDPPYWPLSETSYFTSYTKEGFGEIEQHKLKEFCDQLDAKNVKFLLSNSDIDKVRKLYQEYEILDVYAARQINAQVKGRKKISEVLIKNY